MSSSPIKKRLRLVAYDSDDEGESVEAVIYEGDSVTIYGLLEETKDGDTSLKPSSISRDYSEEPSSETRGELGNNSFDIGNYSQFCDGAFATSTNVMSEELFPSVQSDAEDLDDVLHSFRVAPQSHESQTEQTSMDQPGLLSLSASGQSNLPRRLLSSHDISQLFHFSDSESSSSSDDETSEEEEEANVVEAETSHSAQQSLPSIPTPTPAPPIWNWNDGQCAIIEKQPFVITSGWTCDLDDSMVELDYWKLCFPHEIIRNIVEESNSYAEKDIASCDPETLSKRKRYFKPITENDLLRYFAVRILMGINKKPEYAHYWSKDPIFHSTIIPNIMSVDRFLQIQKYLHFCDNEDSSDKMHKIRELWDSVINNMESLIVPGEALAVDESLTKFRGRLSFRQYIPSKRNRFGIKTFSLVDKYSGFVVKSTVYTGKNDDPQFKDVIKAYGYGGAIVLELCNDYLGCNRTIYADNYFTSPNLAQKLQERSTYLCGTLRSGRKNSPPCPKLKKGEAVSFVSDQGGKPVLVEYWRDKRIVRMVSTGTSHEMIQTVSKSGMHRCKPRSVEDYNMNARGIDLADMAISEYEMARKTMKWYMKLFFRLLELAIYNAFAIMKTEKGRMPFLDFRVNLVKQILEATGGVSMKAKPPSLSGRINASHYPTKFEKPRRCKVCAVKLSGKNVRSMYGCGDCDVGLCVYPCFATYHKTEKF